MDAATLERIFDPFFTTKAVGEGTGLGLAVVLGIMQSHAGTITVLSEPGKGATFHLYFPVHELKAPPPEPVAAPVPPGHGEHILLVDDETSLASVGKKILERLGYTVTAKTTALEAVAAVRDQPEKFQLVITDLTMPEMDGLILCNQLLQIRPDLPIILSTGYTGVMTRAMLREHGFRDLLVKPATIRVLGETVQRVLYPPAA
jgi:CheY-like chemotaxis protein